MPCKLCEERLTEINRILSAYKRDKAFYRKVSKVMAIVIGVLLMELIISLAYGKYGIMLLVELVMRWFGK